MGEREATESAARSVFQMHRRSNRIIVVGAGPVGLCLSLALAQDGVEVCLIEALRRRQLPRPGAARRLQSSGHARTVRPHRALCPWLEPRGIVAPKFHYWDRQEGRLIAEFDHAQLKDDTRFPYVLQCERIKIVEEALEMAKAHPQYRGAPLQHVYGDDAERGRRRAHVPTPPARPKHRGAPTSSARRGAQHRAQTPHIEFEGFTYPERTLNIEVAYDFRDGYTERNYISDPDE